MSETGLPQPSPNSPGRRSWSDLGPRVLSAVVLIAIAALVLWLGGYAFAIIVGLVFALVYREWETMVALRQLSRVGMALMVLVALAAIAFQPWGPLATAVITAVAAIAAAALGGEGAPWRVGGLVFLGVVIVALLSIRGTGIEGFYAAVFLCAVIWMTDSAAFFTGRQIGGEKLAPDISPSKTWSGALGGLALGTAAGVIVWVLVTESPWWIGALLAAATSILGQVGDLTESAIKRRFRIKDSGDLIPGHGGLMDRLDSTSFGGLFLFLVGGLHADFSHIAQGFLNW